MTRPIVAIVGRPNVGKSTLFNRLIGERRSIVEGMPGTTRDRLYGVTEWNGVDFTVVDTAGLLLADEDADLPLAEITHRASEQAELAMAEADLILFMVDARAGMTSADAEIANTLRSSRKPVILAANKADNQERQLDAVEFYALNIGEPIPMSAYHNLGTGDMLDRVVEALPPRPLEEDDPNRVRVAIVGRPNVGKSQLLNALLGQQRSVVSSIPGTTRDSIDTDLMVEETPVTLIDTAGIRRSGKIQRGVERYSVMRTLRAVERCDVALLLIDAVEGITAQDTHIAGMILEAKKGVALLVNKWDALEKDTYTINEYTNGIQDSFRFMTYAPILFISALTGQRVQKVLPLALEIARERHKRISTSALNELLRQAIYKQPPMATKKGAHLRIYYATQPQVAPPVFLFFANDREMVHWSYGRYLENRIREQYGFMGTPLSIVFRSRERERRT
jgi:GTP-binding protein